MFARAIVLCDGSTERGVLPILLHRHFGRNPAGLGVSFVDCESMNDARTQKILHAAHDLALPWLVFADNDREGRDALHRITHPATDQQLTADSDEVVMSGQQQVERLLVDAGYTNEIEQVAQDNRMQMPSGDNAHLDFLRKNKPWAAEQVAVQAMEADKPLPEPVLALARKLEVILGITGPEPAEKP